MDEFFRNAALIALGTLCLWLGCNIVFSAYFNNKRRFLMKLAADAMAKARGNNG